MPPPVSVFHQPDVLVTQVPAWSLMPSPRNYNSSIIEFDGRRIMAYRSHRMDQGGRCGVAICELDSKWQAKPKSNVWLDLQDGAAHHEDPRLFVFKGRLHVAFTEAWFHPAPRPYTCVMKYARLKERPKGKGWATERVFWPRYGRNDGSHQEKNWQFFEARGRLNIIYQAEPHEVLELGTDGESIAGRSLGPKGTVRWPWGTIRGGTPPVRMPDGQWLTIFHSSTPYPFPPHWRRYYAGAYTFLPEPPYRITAISQRPILVGSEHDGHAHDPRNIDSWKPFVVFPSGIIRARNGWHVSYGVNDYLTAVALHTDLLLGEPSFQTWGPKFFRTENGNMPVKIFAREDHPPQWIRWEAVPGGGRAGVCPGVLKITDPRVALQLLEDGAGVEEISESDYRQQRSAP
jgi:predicted GH43/DUF377 family glycosyl hydrolase